MTANARDGNQSGAAPRFGMRAALLLAVFSLLASLVAGEAGLQVVHRVKRGYWCFPGNAFKVNYTMPVDDRREYTARPGYAEGGVTLDSRGFRLPEVAPGARPLVVCLGDSVPFGAGVGNSDTYPARLGKIFAESGSKAKVLCAGLSSYNYRQSADRLRLEVLPVYGAPSVVTLQAANDVSLLTHYRGRYTPDRTWATVRWKKGWTKPWYHKLALVAYAGRIASALRASREKAEADGAANALPEEAMLRAVEAAWDETAGLCRAQGAALILLPIDPCYYQTANKERSAEVPAFNQQKKTYELWDAHITKVNARMEQFAKTRPGVYFLDTRPMFDKLDRKAMYVDFIHYTPEGNQTVAAALHAFIVQHGLLRG
jgi:lysophospholipase L1-like esterase